MMKKTGLALLCCLLCGCSTQSKKVQGTYQNNKGETTSAELVLEEDKIIELKLDETSGDTTKRTLGDDYHMKDASTIGKEWYEQVSFLESYIKKNGVEGIKLDEEGKGENEDLRTGCTISIDGFLKAIADAKNK